MQLTADDDTKSETSQPDRETVGHALLEKLINLLGLSGTLPIPICLIGILRILKLDLGLTRVLSRKT